MLGKVVVLMLGRVVHTSRSLRLSNKQPITRRPHQPSSSSAAAAVKQGHRNSEASTRSSSTPSIPQSLADSTPDPLDPLASSTLDPLASRTLDPLASSTLDPLAASALLDPFTAAADAIAAAAALAEFGGDPHWTQRVAMTMSTESYRPDDEALATPTPDASETDTVGLDEPGGEEPWGEGQGEAGRFREAAAGAGGGAFQKKRSKSADIWRDGSLERSLSDLSQGHMTSMEDMLRGGEEEEEEGEEPYARARGGTERASSLDQLCSPTPGAPRQCRRRAGLVSPSEEEPAATGAFTLPCRRSHCLSEGPGGPCTPAPPCHAFRAAAPTPPTGSPPQSYYTDLPHSRGVVVINRATQRRHSGLGRRRRRRCRGGTVGSAGEEEEEEEEEEVQRRYNGEAELVSRRCKAMSASFSVYSAAECSVFNGGVFNGSAFHGSDSGSSNGEGRGGVYENFRKELDNQAWTHRGRGFREEAGSAMSDERSSGTLSTAYPSDVPIGCSGGTVRKAGALAVKNFLVHKKNKKVEPATRRKWKHYWVSLKGCTLYLYDTDGRSAVDHSSAPKHAVWAESSIVQAVPEHPKKDFTSGQTELENWITAIHSACAGALARHHRRDDTLRLLRSEVRKLEQKIDMDEKMKKMGDMQLSTVTDGKKRKTILEQVAARTESNVRRRGNAVTRPSSKRRSRFSSLWGLDTASRKKNKAPPPSLTQRERDRDSDGSGLPRHQEDGGQVWVPGYLAPSWVCLPSDQPVLAVLQPGDTCLDTLTAVCKAHRLDVSGHYLRVKVRVDGRTLLYVPAADEDVSELIYQEIEICPKATRAVRFDNADSCAIRYGFSVVVVEEEGEEEGGQSQIYVTEVKPEGSASAKGDHLTRLYLHLPGKQPPPPPPPTITPPPPPPPPPPTITPPPPPPPPPPTITPPPPTITPPPPPPTVTPPPPTITPPPPPPPTITPPPPTITPPPPPPTITPPPPTITPPPHPPPPTITPPPPPPTITPPPPTITPPPPPPTITPPPPPPPLLYT
ncbi:hypothetical protein CRUP_000156 [Coryphaenoides rupestris]|nr:hypothetical protein CRUP_000156 [Coryphaenoides rupestris]